MLYIYIQGRHDKSGQKEFLSHTRSAWFFLYTWKWYIEEDRWKNVSKKNLFKRNWIRNSSLIILFLKYHIIYLNFAWTTVRLAICLFPGIFRLKIAEFRQFGRSVFCSWSLRGWRPRAPDSPSSSIFTSSSSETIF